MNNQINNKIRHKIPKEFKTMDELNDYVMNPEKYKRERSKLKIIDRSLEYKPLWDKEVSKYDLETQNYFFNEIWKIMKQRMPDNKLGEHLERVYNDMPNGYEKMAFHHCIIPLDKNGNIIINLD